ncbi:MAG: hypothetical protein GY737_18560 [Desulfobacteraceae bacterium]|nr:hypothetical protein [Desulfobacteraceae bacterium]
MTDTIDQNKGFSDDGEDIIELTDPIKEGLVEEGPDDGSNADVVLEMEKPAGAVDTGNAIPVPSDEALEAALIRIIEKKYAQRLDALFVETVERVVEREIAAIKKSLLKDLS